MNTQIVNISFLADHKEYIADVAKLWHTEWSSNKTNDGYIKQVRSVEHKANNGKIPFILIATDGKNLVGTAAIFEHDLDARPDLFPWLAGVYVKPEYRCRGIARLLIEQTLIEAKNLNIKKIYLHTETAGNYYHKLGWHKLENAINDQDTPCEIYAIDL